VTYGLPLVVHLATTGKDIVQAGTRDHRSAST
jgi:hypothetical protein